MVTYYCSKPITPLKGIEVRVVWRLLASFWPRTIKLIAYHNPRLEPIEVSGFCFFVFLFCFSVFFGPFRPQVFFYDPSLRNFYITWNYGSIRNLRKSSKYQILKNQGIQILNFPEIDSFRICSSFFCPFRPQDKLYDRSLHNF